MRHWNQVYLLGAFVIGLTVLSGCQSDSVFAPNVPGDYALPAEPSTDYTTWGSLGLNSVRTDFAPGTSIPDVCRKSAVGSGGRVVPNRALIVTSGQMTGCNFATGPSGAIQQACKTYQYSTTLNPAYPVTVGCRHFQYTVRRIVNVDGTFVVGKVVGQVDPLSCVLSVTIEDDLPTDRLQISTVSQVSTIPNASGINQSSVALFDCNRSR